MESTGKSWIPICNILENTCNIVLAHPKYVKAIRGKKTDKKAAKWIADIFKHDLVSGSFTPPADIRQLRDLVRYRWKLTSFTTGKKNRVQNCLTASNIKLNDVFSDVFGKAASAITTHFLEHPAEKVTDVSIFRTKGMKATNEQVLAAVDGERCAEQAEKLRIIRSHMNSLELCKLNLESLILTTAEKYLSQLNLVMTALGIQSFAAIGIISEIGVDMSVFPPQSIFASGLDLRRRTTRAPGRRKPLESATPEPASSHCSFSVPSTLSVPSNSRKPEIATLRLKSAEDTRKRLLPSPEYYSPQFTICSRRMSPTTLDSTARVTGHLYTGRFPWKKLSSSSNARVVW